MLITHLSIIPYRLSLVILAIKIISTAALSTFFVEHQGESWLIIYERKNDAILVTNSILISSSFTCIMVFMIARIFEHGILLFFIDYQKNLKVEELDVAKDKYQKLESIARKKFIIITIVFSAVLTVIEILVVALRSKNL